ncbi:hypothetical protein [Accumulibacter sp.]|uniref:LysM domain-containing protein n=1 Tax=Candidatus Accumulibacter phosphatis TaxID=327160 RepID=A0A080LZ55_9PROT|nr:hypothetical protein [Accumulibacter sp.]KFB74046.1 MAG: hypothetical protein AW09_000677 [Candidatus Accumulibacter phosphatis]HRF06670.1 hypothetical protein [Accumulibacter sp.]
MAAKGSRYAQVRAFVAEDGRQPAFKGGRARHIGAAAGVLEYTVKADDRLDLLARNFYVDSRKWWRILDANPEIVCGADLGLDDYVGSTILIPRASEAGGGQ